MKLKKTFMVFFVGLVGLISTTFAAPVQAQLCPTDSKLAKLVAASDLILVGRMTVPKRLLVNEAHKQSPDYLNMPIDIEAIVKGGSLASAIVRFYPKDTDYKPSNAAVARISGERAIFFLTRVDQEPRALYFAGYTPDALEQATESNLGAVRAEVSRQTRIVSFWRADTTAPHFAEVSALIARLGQVRDAEQQRVFDQLLALGVEAVPAIIAQMDDRRLLLTREISLVNHSPNAFEPVRHYGPEQIVDGLDAVLNQITGESFGSVMNGGSKQMREATVVRWRLFAAELSCKKQD
ncbi:hypothetical protein [Novosphingobium sp. B-7]|uniref:hypothetical protein n=1 Tax=Novosphingobium sp. B-7 TaxID=1298855 RepID=UPI0011D21AF7|nr:hypothetical protein [Novosphingobium sp. B-7]